MDRKQSEEWQSRVSRTVNSTACFSLTYVIITYLLWFAMGITGKLYKFDSLIYYYGITFILNSHAWSPLKVASVYCAGPFSILIIALLGIYLFGKMKKIKTILNLFFLWLFIVGMGIFLSQFIIAALGIYKYHSLYYQGLAVSFAWLKIPVSIVYALNALALVFVVYIGVNCARPFLAFSYSYSKVNSHARRRKYFFEIALVPYILGSLITIIAIFPKDWSAKNVLILLASTHLIYIAAIGIILAIGYLSLAYLEITKQELVRYKSLQMPNVIVIITMAISWAYIYITFRGIYLTS